MGCKCILLSVLSKAKPSEYSSKGLSPINTTFKLLKSQLKQLNTFFFSGYIFTPLKGNLERSY